MEKTRSASLQFQLEQDYQYKRLLRSEGIGTVGTAAGILIPDNRKRVGLIVSAPVPSGVPSPGLTSVHNVSVAAATTVLTYTQPANTSGILTFASYVLTAGATPTMDLRYTPSGGSAILLLVASNTTPQVQQVLNMPIGPGDSVDWTVAGVGAGGTADLAFCVQQSSTNSRVTLDFGKPAVLDNGIGLFPGLSPFPLFQDFIGTGLRESVWAIAAQTGVQIGYVELMHP